MANPEKSWYQIYKPVMTVNQFGLTKFVDYNLLFADAKSWTRDCHKKSGTLTGRIIEARAEPLID